jgi:hypothetical protein
VFFAGFVGTLLMSLVLYYINPLLAGRPLDIAQTLSDALGGSWISGYIAHYLLGTLIFPAIYALFVYRRLLGSPAARGATWGFVLWLLTQVALMPLLGGGFFSSQAGGFVTALGSFLGHLVYGLALGSLGGGPRDATGRQALSQPGTQVRQAG